MGEPLVFSDAELSLFPAEARARVRGLQLERAQLLKDRTTIFNKLQANSHGMPPKLSAAQFFKDHLEKGTLFYVRNQKVQYPSRTAGDEVPAGHHAGYKAFSELDAGTVDSNIKVRGVVLLVFSCLVFVVFFSFSVLIVRSVLARSSISLCEEWASTISSCCLSGLARASV